MTGQNLGKHLCLGSRKGLSQEIRGMMRSEENHKALKPQEPEGRSQKWKLVQTPEEKLA